MVEESTLREHLRTHKDFSKDKMIRGFFASNVMIIICRGYWFRMALKIAWRDISNINQLVTYWRNITNYLTFCHLNAPCLLYVPIWGRFYTGVFS